MASVAKGVSRAALNFIVIGLGFPYVIESFSSGIVKYMPLPPPGEVWDVFIALGAAFAVTGFLQQAYSKGQYPWLFGRLGSGGVEIALFTYAFSLIPRSLSTGPVSGGVETSNLLYLVYLAIVLPYGYLVLDFYDARRRTAAGASLQAPAPKAG